MRTSLLGLLLLVGCTPQLQQTASAPTAAEPSPYQVCWTAPEGDACVIRVEQELIAQAGGRVERAGDRLLIRTTEGWVVPLENRPDEGGHGSLHYRYYGYIEPLNSYLVAVGFFEGGAFVLVSAETGNQTHIQAPPIISPDRARFATASLDLEAGYNPNGIQVWRITEAGPRFEWGVEGGDRWGASDLAWVSPDRIEFTRHTVVPPDWQPVPTRMELRLGDTALEVRPLR